MITPFVMEISQPYYGTLNDLTMYNPLAIVNPKAFETDPFEACKRDHGDRPLYV